VRVTGFGAAGNLLISFSVLALAQKKRM